MAYVFKAVVAADYYISLQTVWYGFMKRCSFMKLGLVKSPISSAAKLLKTEV